ncbi:WD40-repeat-containing domain protein [Chytridium lagenaria]|nr:WD40-repeat-containing domain protein [Chytridium lagenaria]
MGDAFFAKASQGIKRKRLVASTNGKKFNPLLKSERKKDGSVVTPSGGRARGGRGPKGKGKDEDIEGSDDDGGMEAIDDMDLTRKDNDLEDEDDEDIKETAAQKRLRLAKRYITKLQEDTIDDGEVDAAEIDREIIAHRLRDDVLQSKGLLFQQIAQKYAHLGETLQDETECEKRTKSFKKTKKGNQQPVTSVAIAIPKPKSTELPSLQQRIFIYTASKDALVKWDFWTGKRLHTFPKAPKPTNRMKRRFGDKKNQIPDFHTDGILCVDVSFDGRYLATGGLDKVIHIWSTEDDSHVGSFKQHRDAVTGLAFRKGPVNHLYSCSLDRTVKVWNVDEMTYVETLFGHQDHVLAIDALAMERCVTAGARDLTARMWKVVEESQLIFRGGGGSTVKQDVIDGLVLASEVGEAKREAKRIGAANFGGSIDVIAMVDEKTFLTGTDNGWKPLYTYVRAHGPKFGENTPEIESSSCNWIVSLAANPYTDLFASGSCEGFVRLWKIVDDRKKFVLLSKLPAVSPIPFVSSSMFFICLNVNLI